jgi:hypothetical protein
MMNAPVAKISQRPTEWFQTDPGMPARIPHEFCLVRVGHLLISCTSCLCSHAMFVQLSVCVRACSSIRIDEVVFVFNVR